jgi:peptidoglycan/xylan/chitin deacetylase (PgdA/CDA1 family)
VYHRVDRDRRAPGIVPSIPEEVFRRHVETLADLGDVVGLREVLAGGPARRPRFALTFDDDFRSHAETVLPSLRRAGVVGAFFLSGRALHGLGAYWFERLDALVASVGASEAGRRIGAHARDGRGLAVACERDAAARGRLEALDVDAPVDQLSARDTAELAAAGMTVGFHTLHHHELTRASNGDVSVALRDGRAELERAAGTAIDHFAYPHGKADARVAAAVAGAGFASAWTGVPRAVGRRSDRFRLGRWEPGALAVDDLIVALAVRMTVDG